jgi:hypothetical protein
VLRRRELLRSRGARAAGQASTAASPSATSGQAVREFRPPPAAPRAASAPSSAPSAAATEFGG